MRRSGGNYDFDDHGRDVERLNSKLGKGAKIGGKGWGTRKRKNYSWGNSSYSLSAPKTNFSKLIVFAIILFFTAYVIHTYGSEIQNLNTNSNDENKTLIENLSSNIENSSLVEIFEEPDIDKIESLVFNKTNKVRRGLARDILYKDKQLSELARAHSQDMANRDFFDHVNPDGDDPTLRAEKAGINVRVTKGDYVMVGIAENISQVPLGNVEGCGIVYSEEEIAECAIQGWINSPGHYANMINIDYRDLGVGVATDGSKYYLTQNFR